MRVGYDLDGVGYVFGEAVRDSLRSQGIAVNEMTDEFCASWDFYEQWGMTREDFDRHVDWGVDAGIVFGPGDHLTRPGFFDSIRDVKAMGHEIIVITHRYQGSKFMAEENTYKWLAPVRHLIDEIYFSSDKTIVPTDMFVEDNLGNYDALKSAGTDAFLINRPWNGPYDDHRSRINDISDYTAEVAAVTERLSMV